MAPRPRRLPALLEELLEEVLLRFPPDDPASLARASLVSKRWCRLISGRGFRRRYRELHRRSPPLLGFVCNVTWNIDDDSPDNALFVPTSRCLPRSERPGWRALDARHGRVLLYLCPGMDDFAAWDPAPFVVWNPITGDELQLPCLPPERCYPWPVCVHAAVLCSGGGDACDHLDCHRGSFLVVVVAIYDDGMFVHVYSSEVGAWSEPTIADEHPRDYVDLVPAALVGNAVHFVFKLSTRILKYDLGTREMSLIDMPSTSYGRIMLMTTDEGRLGFTRAEDFKLYLLSMEVGPQNDVVWTQDRVIDLQNLLPADALLSSPDVAGYVNGLGVIIVATVDGFFTVDPESNKAVKVGEGIACMKEGDVDIGYGHVFYIAVSLHRLLLPSTESGL